MAHNRTTDAQPTSHDHEPGYPKARAEFTDNCAQDPMGHDPQPCRIEGGEIGEECRNCGQVARSQ